MSSARVACLVLTAVSVLRERERIALAMHVVSFFFYISYTLFYPNPVVGSDNDDCARCEECSSSSCLGCIALSEPYNEGIGSGELFKLVMGMMLTANTTAGNK